MHQHAVRGCVWNHVRSHGNIFRRKWGCQSTYRPEIWNLERSVEAAHDEPAETRISVWLWYVIWQNSKMTEQLHMSLVSCCMENEKSWAWSGKFHFMDVCSNFSNRFKHNKINSYFCNLDKKSFLSTFLIWVYNPTTTFFYSPACFC